MTMLSRFRGSMLGSLMGDCLGGPFEGDAVVSRTHLNNYFQQLRDPKKRLPFKPYTDDTAMTKSVALSLIDNKGYNAQDMAKRFTKEYFAEPKRGYGSAVHDVFMGLRNSNCEDPYRPAQRQFQGMGSYGNGAAMRVAPVALMAHNDEAAAIEIATMQSKITHSHKLGYQGAVLQCLAVRAALHTQPDDLNVVKFTDDLIAKMREIEKKDADTVVEDVGEESDAPWNTTSYARRLETVKSFLQKPEPPPMEEIHGLLGVHVSALKSVPTAIYCFLASQKSLPGIECNNNKFQRCIHFAISLGGDTDTIAAMSGAIAGAFFGEEHIPQELLRHCEAVKNALSWADKLCEASSNAKLGAMTQ
ncbi:Poly(ADP-ribose) glycohydrolase ARH3 [Orchesella cincta]|uniref:ADP-ribosylhydrolase ARH3 n=1 Tax=Orchesella cincta TaxID=48709 RepID=A0A1D2N9Z2_ORCCI|nr:Poly(ADP-ribose) glycohydrolase ARH3 [Orchesella cincta]